ncbi:hypothetical protein niasHT_027013 [Heterodera trifolii]|uniref:BACK domain-containing protein n=1 Tax=Heterodera trifolii TaxID=157864 RepID=A0ABD2K0T7_9BILA
MLRFIYTADLSGLNGDNAISLFCAAKKFHLSELANACANFPISKLHNVFLALHQARHFEEKEFALRCLDHIDQNAYSLLKSDAFLKININYLCEILARDQFQAEEITIWNAALRWADEQCRQMGKECSGENRRAMLGPALFQIRFPLIQLEEFPRNIAVSGVLTSDELLGVLLHLANPSVGCTQPPLYPLSFTAKQRNYNVSGTVTLKIDNLSEFGRTTDNTERYSNSVLIREIPWKISASFDTSDTSCPHHRVRRFVDFWLHCDVEENNKANWRYECKAILRIVAQNKAKEDYTLKKLCHIFHTSSDRKKIFRGLMFMDLIKKINELDNEKDTVTLVADIQITN